MEVTDTPDGGVTISSTRTMPADVPSYAKSFVGDSLTVTEVQVWGPVGPDGSSRADVTVDFNAPISYKGSITMDVPFPSLKAWWVSLFSDESLLRPRYHGTGTVYLDSSLGGFHVMRVAPGERWILAVDLGNGGPKVAVVGLDGEVRCTAIALGYRRSLTGTTCR